jgi:putative endonuclease
MDKNKKMNTKIIGSFGENQVYLLLQKEGYHVLEKNFRFSRMGEIDIIAYDGDTLCFIEVKSRKSSKFGMPAEAVIAKKIHKIRSLSQVYLKKHNLFNVPIRFDVVEVFLKKERDSLEVESIHHIKNAF